MAGASAMSSSRFALGSSHGVTEMALPPLQLLPWLDDGLLKGAVAADGDRDLAAASKTTGRRRSAAARADLARGMKVFLSGVAEMVGKRFERSIPAAKFGHVAYIR